MLEAIATNLPYGLSAIKKPAPFALAFCGLLLHRLVNDFQFLVKNLFTILAIDSTGDTVLSSDEVGLETTTNYILHDTNTFQGCSQSAPFLFGHDDWINKV